MTDLHYLANIRLPTEKAHGLQIMQNCEAFAAHAAVTLYPARRIQPLELRGAEAWSFYDLPQSFTLRYVPTVDLLPLLGGRVNLLSRLFFYKQSATYNAALALALRGASPDAIYYTRDYLTLSAAKLYKPARRIFWEVHSLASTPRKRQMQAATASQLGGVIAITQYMADALIDHGVDPDRVMVAPDGIRAERFSQMPTRSEARAALGLPEDAFMVGYMGRLHTLNMSKGVDDIVQAIAARPETPLHLLLVGGPDEMVEEYRALWASLGLPEERFHGFGAVPAADVPAALAAFDVAVMPFPWTEHFAYYASPLKLFEYMASERPIVATALPSTQEIVTDGENGLLVPPSDANALADALVRLYADPALGQRIAAAARQEVFARYTWAARARDIMAFIARHA